MQSEEDGIRLWSVGNIKPKAESGVDNFLHALFAVVSSFSLHDLSHFIHVVGNDSVVTFVRATHGKTDSMII